MIERQFRQAFDRNPDLKRPRTFNEKLQWLKLYWRDDLASRCADKAEVRDYVQDRVGSEVLNRIHGVYDAVDDIPWNQLPSGFVLKVTHGSGWNVICRDRSKFDADEVAGRLNLWMRSNPFWKTREWVYKDLKPRVLIEELLSENDGTVPMDYKVFCFHGEPRYIEVDIDRFGTHRRNIYDTQWRLQPVAIKYPRDPEANPPRPPLVDMLEKSRALAAPFPHVRVDWFCWQGQLRFGEMTFFHGMGRERFSPPEWDREFGRLLRLEVVGGPADEE